MRRLPVELCVFQDARGRHPFADWFDLLGDQVVQARVMQRLDRLQAGNAGDCRALGSRLMELRIDTGPGYRVYFIQRGEVVIVLLAGGNKSTQNRDIRNAKALAKDLKE